MINIELHVQPGDVIDVVNEWQFPFLNKEYREKHGIEAQIKLHEVIVIWGLKLYGHIIFETKSYKIPLDRIVKL